MGRLTEELWPIKFKRTSGFSLVELLVVSAIIATLSVVFIFNFRNSASNKSAVNQVVAVVVSDIRRTQSMATSSSRYNNNLVCGFGLHYADNTSYLIFAESSGAPCGTPAARTYQSGDGIIESRKLTNQNIEIKASFYDIFFEPPDPKVAINGSVSLTSPPPSQTVITVGPNGRSCGGGVCTNIVVNTSGAVNVVDN